MRGKECENGLHRMLKRAGLHWTVNAQMARRGGFKGTPLLTPEATDGYIQSLRDAEQKALAQKIDDGHTGGYGGDVRILLPGNDLTHPPVLDGPEKLTIDPIEEPMEEADGMTMSFTLDETMNPWVGQYPADVNAIDFTLQEEECRALLYGRDTWLVPVIDSPCTIEADFHTETDRSFVTKKVTPYLMDIPADLHAPLLNWIVMSDPEQSEDFESTLAGGLRNIMAHGNSILRPMASDTLARFRCLDRFHAGEGGVCRITWGKSTTLDDCVCQMLCIGPLHFCAIDYGDAVSLTETLQRKIGAVDKEERNQCTLLAVAAGIISSDLKPGNLPARSRVAKLAVELRGMEWNIAHPIAGSEGEPKSVNEKTLLSLGHDIVHPNHDRDYRSLGCS